jgi:hypothetical protein
MSLKNLFLSASFIILLISTSCLDIGGSSSCSNCDIHGIWYNYDGYLDENGDKVFSEFGTLSIAEGQEQANIILQFINSNPSRLIIDSSPRYEFRDDCNYLIGNSSLFASTYSTNDNCTSIDFTGVGTSTVATSLVVRDYGVNVKSFDGELLIRL